MLIHNLSDLVKSFDNAPAAWPGGYPTYYVTADGGTLSYEAVVDNIEEVIFSIENPEFGDDWRIIGLDVNYEDSSLYCDHTYNLIPKAYEDLTVGEIEEENPFF